DAAGAVVQSVRVPLPFRDQAGLGEERLYRQRRQFAAQYLVATCGQPVHVEGFAGQRHEYRRPFGRSQRRPVLFQQRHYGLAVEAGAALAPALQPEIRIHRALLSGMRDGTPPPRYMLATARGAPPRAAASGYDVLLDVEAIDLLPPPRQQPTPRRPRSQIRIQVLERQGHGALAAVDLQFVRRTDCGHGDDPFGAELGARDVDQLVALALVQFRQLRGGDRQQVAGAGHRDDAVGLRVHHQRRLQHGRARGQVDQGLAGLVAAGEVLEAGDEAVAVRGGEHEAGVVLAAGQGQEGGAAGGREAAGQWLAVATRRGQAVRRRGIAAALR